MVRLIVREDVLPTTTVDTDLVPSLEETLLARISPMVNISMEVKPWSVKSNLKVILCLPDDVCRDASTVAMIMSKTLLSCGVDDRRIIGGLGVRERSCLVLRDILEEEGKGKVDDFEVHGRAFSRWL